MELSTGKCLQERSTSLKIEDLSFEIAIDDAEQVSGGFHYDLSRLLRQIRRRYHFSFGCPEPHAPSPLPDGPIPVEPDLPDGSPNPGNFPPTIPPFAMGDDTMSYSISGDGFGASFSSSVSYL